MIALAYYSPPTRQPIDAADSGYRESPAGFLSLRGWSAASSIAAPGCTPTRSVEQRHGADGVPAHTPSPPTCSTCGAELTGVGSGKFPSGYCPRARYGIDGGCAPR